MHHPLHNNAPSDQNNVNSSAFQAESDSLLCNPSKRKWLNCTRVEVGGTLEQMEQVRETTTLIGILFHGQQFKIGVNISKGSVPICVVAQSGLLGLSLTVGRSGGYNHVICHPKQHVMWAHNMYMYTVNITL